MNKNIIEFYMLANKLKSVIRTGWKEVGIPEDKIESVADHIYGCLTLSIAIISEKKLNLNQEKIFKMLIIKELKKAINMKEVSINQNETNNDRDLIVSALDSLTNKEELLKLYDEFNSQETEESKFVLYVSKLESDAQAKIYDLDGDFKLENAIEDVKKYPEGLSDEILPKVKNASDGWIEYDRKYYNDVIFTELSKEIQDLEKL